jgi:hypothetical protein
MAFTSNTYTATLDIKRRTPQRPLIIEGDAGVLLDLSLTDDGVAMDITGLYARCVFRRSDGRTVLVSESDDPCPMTVTKSTGRIVITVPRTCFRDGDNFLQVQILDGDPDSGTCLSSTFPLLLRAYNCLLTNEAVEESVEFPILEWLIDALRNMTVTGVTIDPDDDGWPTATASLALTDGAYHLTLGIPRGNGIASVVVDSSNPQLIITYEDGTVALAMLNGIASQTWVEAQEYIDADELSAALTDYASKAYVAHAIANAGYYSKPTGGIPASDLSEAVQDSLDLADSAIQQADLAGYYQLPSGGIPSTDMSAAVQLALARANSALQDMAVMEGATSQKNGTKGAVPAPQTTDVDKFLKGDGTWATPSGGGGGGGTTDDVTVKLPATIVTLGLVETGDLVSEAMAQVNNLVYAVEDLQDDKLDVNGDGSSVYATRGSASINYGDIPATDPVTLRDLLRRLGGWYAEINGKAAASNTQTPFLTATLTIATTDWVNGSCTKTVTGMTADALVFVKYSDTETEYTEAQGANSMTFTAATTPSEAVTVDVAWLKEVANS